MIVVVGEALVDIVDRGDYPGNQTGGDLPDERVGGGPLNIAVGLARLEQPSLLITQTSDDEPGARIMAHLHDNDVAVVSVPTSSGRSATATAHLDRTGAATYEFDLEWSLPHQELPDCDALHVGSLVIAVEPGRDAVFDLVEQAYGRGTFLSFDPNLRPFFVESSEAAWQDTVSIADRATLVKMSDDDVAVMAPGADPGDIARVLLQGERTELVVVTHGADGAVGYAATGDDVLEVRVPSPAVQVVDTVGAGDTFTAALLAVLADDGALSDYGRGSVPQDEAGIRRLLHAAASAAAVTCSRPGADPPRRFELPAGWPD